MALTGPIFVIITIFFHLPQVLSDVITCGGYVTASSSLAEAFDTKLDYSFVKMHLFTKEGLLKYSTECAPNGYYFIPVYDQGQFFLEIEGPDGWAFDPPRVDLTVSSDSHSCNDDINFRFTGFGLSGSVQSVSRTDCVQPQTGPQGVQLTLYSLDKGSQKVQRAVMTSNSKGQFTFENVFPGQYIVSASHPKWTILPEHEQSIKMEWGNAALPKPFLVKGYSLVGDIASSGEAVEGVDVLLYGSAESKNTKIDCSIPSDLPAQASSSLGSVLCGTRSDAAGRFRFTNLPCGQYTLVAHYKRTHTTFDVKPESLPVSLLHDDQTLSSSFQVLGFSIHGHVLDHERKGVKDATIKVNGVKQTVTDNQGAYHLDRIKTGKYTIRVEAQHRTFREVEFQLSPSLAQIPDIIVDKYQACGNVDLGKGSGGSVRTIKLTSDNLQLETKTNAKGDYCFEVSPGNYLITPTLSKEEQSQGLLLSPPNREVVIKSQPILDANFIQARVSISGRVRCIEPCGKLSLSLTSTGRATRPPHNTVLDDHDRFKFDQVFPGSYKLTASNEFWCWNEASVVLEVAYEDIKNIELVQSGYMLQATLSHDITLNITLISSSSGASDEKGVDKSFKPTKGTNQFCLARPGTYALRPVSCYRFEKEVFTYDTSRPQKLELQARDFRVRGSIFVLPDPAMLVTAETHPTLALTAVGNAPPDHPEEEAFESLIATYTGVKSGREIVDSWRNVGDGLTEGEIAVLSSLNQVLIYEYSFWSPPGIIYRITPTVQREIAKGSDFSAKEGSEESVSPLLFYPRHQETDVGRVTCPKPVHPFIGRTGLFLTGRVSPPVEDVQITITFSSSHIITLKTNTKGEYRVGPFYDDEKYTINAKKAGYQFVADDKDSKHSFRAFKLGEIIVTVLLSHPDGTNSLLPGVLLSLTGPPSPAEPYRNNQETNEDGESHFIGLNPGQYLLRPLLKEYEFTPVSASLDVVDAGTVTKQFIAHRVAYSVFGTVTSLNGKPEKGISIEAIEIVQHTSDSKKKHVRFEQATSDENGNYRLRGLVPDSKYRISIRRSDDGNQASTERSSVERSSPESVNITVGRQDSKAIDFIIFRRVGKLDLTGNVVADSQWLDTLEVTLALASSPNQVVKIVPITAAFPYFDWPALQAGTYIVALRTSLSSRTHDFHASSQTVTLNTHTHVTLNFEATVKTQQQEFAQHSLFSLIVCAILTLGLINYKQTMELINKFLNRNAPKPTSAGWETVARKDKKGKKS